MFESPGSFKNDINAWDPTLKQLNQNIDFVVVMHMSLNYHEDQLQLDGHLHCLMTTTTDNFLPRGESLLEHLMFFLATSAS